MFWMQPNLGSIRFFKAKFRHEQHTACVDSSTVPLASIFRVMTNCPMLSEGSLSQAGHLETLRLILMECSRLLYSQLALLTPE